MEKKNRKRKNTYKKKLEFSKALLIQESILIWLTTIAMVVLAFFCVVRDYMYELPWVAVLAGLIWGAYGVSQHAYYKKAQAENTKNGIKYETVMNNYIEEEQQQDEADENGILG